MNSERWMQVKNVIEAVLERPISERAAYLDKSCGADGGQRRFSATATAGRNGLCSVRSRLAHAAMGTALIR